MNDPIKTREQILNKLGISALNEMQKAVDEAYPHHSELVLISPTGSGKTLAFLLPIIENLEEKEGIQVLIMVPSRELAIQIEQIIRNIGSGYRALAVFGGRSSNRDRTALQSTPSILVGTPGRIADHLRNEILDFSSAHTLVLDEFDKSLEVGFENEMREICYHLENVSHKILTSATESTEIPVFINLKKPFKLKFEKDQEPRLNQIRVTAKKGNKPVALADLLKSFGKKRGIVFCNFKDSIADISDYLHAEGINHAKFYGGLEQLDREQSLIKFRNGSCNILLATDLAARGLDIPELDYIIHYELPQREDAFIHRNGRTARMHAHGTAYILHELGTSLPPFIPKLPATEPSKASGYAHPTMETLYITGGRKDKISKGDVAGLFLKEGGLNPTDLGLIELHDHCTYVGIKASKAKGMAQKLNNSRLKKKKVRISLLR
ncbi:DEAD/DEAH box helicase [Luteibaculum oceani]|uniref:DEAD/DEAH box helicase n=1 Tax=Luteibaculum oceani TaxID=1294296 RepID=A0A5C6V1U1_9FLAO|nr:DEAD/DEAH box helicase [Luteibaculum oceani]TXC76965.1 DEAD/DEAH box helicase [Luteibaculum oceani]